MHVDARFDIIENKGFWLNGKTEKEIDDVDWLIPDAESNSPKPKQPYNPNLLALIIGCLSCPMSRRYVMHLTIVITLFKMGKIKLNIYFQA